MSEKLGIIQSRGLGDIVIALPIAWQYHKEGNEIYWPICEEFISHFKDVVPWVNWLAVKTDNGSFFYDTPMQILGQMGVENALCLYQALTGHPEFSSRPEFQIAKFDQYKYFVSGVPFVKKWQLSECLTRNTARELDLFSKLNLAGQNYVVLHLNGSDHEAKLDPSWIPEGYKTVTITEQTDCIFDWLTVIENAQGLIAVDSIISNIVDQLGLTDQVDCYFIPRSHIHLTPVLGGSWTILEPEESVMKRITIFKSS